MSANPAGNRRRARAFGAGARARAPSVTLSEGAGVPAHPRLAARLAASDVEGRAAGTRTNSRRPSPPRSRGGRYAYAWVCGRSCKADIVWVTRRSL